ncbi:UNVERIFIED_CONTAM: hypothetical protein FKN15_027857 [Acipenser sinensis]
MGKKHKKHKSEWRTVDDYVNKPLEKPLKLVLKVGGSEVTELSGSGHDSSYYDDRSDYERERHKEKKKKKKKKSEKEKDKHVGDEERRRRKEEKKRKREREQCDTEGEVEGANEVKKMEGFTSVPTDPRKDPHGFFAFPVTDAIAPGYSMIIKHPMDFGTIKDKIEINDYKSVTEFKIGYLKKDADGALVYTVVNQSDPETEEEETHPVDLSSLSNKLLPGLTTLGFKDDRRNRVTYLNSAYNTQSLQNNTVFPDLRPDEMELLYSAYGDDTEEETHPVDLSSLSNKLLPGLTTLGFKDDRRNRVTYLNSAYNTQSLQNNTVFPDLRPDEMELLYSAYGDDTGVQCALSLQEFVKGCGNFTKTIVDGLLDQMTGGDHSKAVYQIRQRRNIGMKPPDETKTNLYNMQVGDAAGMAGDSNSSVLDFMSMKSYSDMSLDMSMLNTLGKTVKKEPDHEDGHLHFDDATKLLQDLHEAQNDRVGSRPSSNLSSLSNASERDQHHLESPAHLSVGEQAEMVHDPYEFLQSPEPGSTANS